MLDDWYDSVLATSDNVSASDSNASAFTTYYGTKQGTGWVYTDRDDDGEYNYYYLVTYRDDDNSDNTTRNVAFNSFNNDNKKRAKTINGKVYLFGTDGKMLKGVQYLEDGTPGNEWGGVICKALEGGNYYYFNDGTGVQGQMMYGKQFVTDDGETYNYYFDKNTGAAVLNSVVDGYLYGTDGRRIDADDGNSNGFVDIDDDAFVTVRKTNGSVVEYIGGGSRLIVSSNGKVRTSTSGYTRVDGEQWKVTKKNEEVDANGYQVWRVEGKDE